MNAKNRIVLGAIALSLAVGAALGLRSRRDDIVVQLINSRTGKPLTNVTLMITERYRVPLLSSMPFVPYNYRWKNSSRVIITTNGAFTIKRISPGGLLHSEALAFDIEKRNSGPHFLYATNGFWRHQMKIIQERPVKSFIWRPLEEIEVPSNNPVVFRLDPNKDFDKAEE
jgi:hypothetical protein